MTLNISTVNIASAHEQVVQWIWRRGDKILTEDGAWTREIQDARITILDPLSEPRVSKFSPLGPLATNQYSKDLLNGCKNEFEYDYHGRLFKFDVDANGAISSDCKNDQISYIKNKLKIKPTSRRAIATTWKRWEDQLRKDVPCLQFIQCMIRNNKLNMYVLFRSNDMLTAFGQNAYGLTDLQKTIADYVGVPMGTYTHYAIAAHIYESEITKAEKFL
jgi:thymidylate synthase